MKPYLFLLVAFVVAILYRILTSKKSRTTAPDSKISAIYHYGRQDFFMTRSETDFFKILVELAGEDYHVFPQVHLSTILDESKVTGQDWKMARRHINQKSVDYVICDRSTIKPLLAIELDDSSHEAEDRRLRDVEVERIFTEAKLPLVRFTNHGNLNKEDISRQITQALATP